jgi:CRP-like cAMP-binding protein
MTDVTQGETLGALLGGRGSRRRLPAGAILFLEGDEGPFVYAVVRGRIKLTAATPSGREVLLSVREPGEIFGELAALDGRPRSATASALEDAEVAQMDAPGFLGLLEAHPAMAVEVLRDVSAGLRAASLRLSRSAGSDTAARVAHHLLDLAARVREHHGSPAAAELTITQDDLAAWAGTTRESVARVLSRFRAGGLVLTGRGHITVKDPAALARLVP